MKLDKRFIATARKYLDKMSTAQSSLQPLERIFGAGQEVRQNHCDVVLFSLTRFCKSLQFFRNLLSEIEGTPTSPSVDYYMLIISLDYIDELKYQLETLIIAYRSNCHSYTKPVLLQKHKIQQKLKIFLQRTENFLQQVSCQIDKNHIPEKKPVIVYPYDSDLMQQNEGIIVLLYRHFTLPYISDYSQ